MKPEQEYSEALLDLLFEKEIETLSPQEISLVKAELGSLQAFRELKALESNLSSNLNQDIPETPEVWAGIAAEIQPEPVPVLVPKPGKIPYGWSAAAAILLLLGGWWLGFSMGKNQGADPELPLVLRDTLYQEVLTIDTVFLARQQTEPDSALPQPVSHKLNRPEKGPGIRKKKKEVPAGALALENRMISQVREEKGQESGGAGNYSPFSFESPFSD